MKFLINDKKFEMLAYIQEIKENGSAKVIVRLSRDGEEIYAEEYSVPIEIERFCASCGEKILNEKILKIRVENFLPNESGGLVLVKFTSKCVCMRKRYKRVYLRGENFLVFI